MNKFFSTHGKASQTTNSLSFQPQRCITYGCYFPLPSQANLLLRSNRQRSKQVSWSIEGCDKI